MYATLTRRNGHGTTAGGPDPDLRLRQIGWPIELVVQFSADRPADPGAFEVRRDHPLGNRGGVPTVGSVLTFDGPIPEAVEAAGDRALRERIEPLMADHPGAVRMLTLWQPELRRQVVITLATSLESLEDGGNRISGMPLLPGEDLALLPGPDRVELFRVATCP